MRDEEIFMLTIIKNLSDKNMIAGIVQSFIQQKGPLSNEAGDKVKEILANLKK